ncbi:hypothetical protein Ljam_0434 [Legionella jamestowniensis]|uniref:Uncharacterized protein n=1 Tax=Legionella jamestowniensis TaxID=455 RepID=A0A0W0UTP5_9GAMM|nr:hypothetical protein Ljam_0434 [Legionella jamestowniensis]
MIWRRERDSNPRYVAVYTLSRRAPSTARPSLLKREEYTDIGWKSTIRYAVIEQGYDLIDNIYWFDFYIRCFNNYRQ